MKAIIITGTSSGLGKALFNCLAKAKIFLVCISRRYLPDQIKIANNKKDRIILIKHDLRDIKTLLSKCSVVKHLLMNQLDDIVFINNAGIIDPIQRIGTLKQDSVIDAISVNLTAPILITNYILQIAIEKSIKIVNITTGAAKRPIPGWSIYCSTKSASRMFFDVLQKQSNEIIVHHFDPGVMDTKMQKKIRLSSQEDLPDKTAFVDLKKEKRLKDPMETAEKILTELKIL